jgi:hypothetical protein
MSTEQRIVYLERSAPYGQPLYSIPLAQRVRFAGLDRQSGRVYLLDHEGRQLPFTHLVHEVRLWVELIPGR